MAVLKLENVQFSYVGRPVLTGITHTFEANTFTAVLGTNGSGKTTLIRLLNRILQPQNGHLFLEGKNIRGLRGKYLATQIAYVQQSHTPALAVTVFDTVLAGRNPHMDWLPSGRDREMVAEILAELHLEYAAMREINTLSGGQQQKVFLARALAQETPIIILDEPTSNLDPRHQAETLGLLRLLTENGKTIIMAIHDVNLAARYCTHFLMLKNGTALAAGPVQEINAALLEQVYEVPVQKHQSGERTYFLF